MCWSRDSRHIVGLGWFLAVAVLVVPSVSVAVELDYYTYGGFRPTVDAFRRLALVFSDEGYGYIIAAFAAAGMLFGGVASGIKGISGAGPGARLHSLLVTLVGISIYTGTILNTDTIHIYDEVRNEYEAVDDVPELIIVIAGFTNRLERLVVDVLDDGSAYPYGENVGGIGFELLYNAATESSEIIDDAYLTKSLGQYFDDCSEMALVSAGYDFDLQQLKSGTDDLGVLLGELVSGSEYTVYYDVDNKGGVTKTCQEVWDDIQPLLMAEGTFIAAIESTCEKSGYDITVPVELTACREKLGELAEEVYGVAGSDDVQLMRNIAITAVIYETITDMNPNVGVSQLSNRTILTEGMGSWVTANSWMPTVRATFLALSLGLMPLLVAFLPTPWLMRALMAMFTLLVWIAFWGVADVVVHQMIMDQAHQAVNEIKRHQMGIEAILLTPPASLKALALFGKARSAGIMIATLLTGLLMRVSTHTLTEMAGGWSRVTESAGARASEVVATAEGFGSKVGQLDSAYASSFGVTQMGFAGYTHGGAQNAGTHRSAGQQREKLGSEAGMTPGETMKAHGAMQGGAAGGELGGVQALAGEKGLGGNGTAGIAAAAASNAFLRALSSQGSTLNRAEMADALQDTNPGMTRQGAMQMVAEYEASGVRGDINATGGGPEELVAAKALGTSEMLGSAAARRDAYATEGVTPREGGAGQGIGQATSSMGALRAEGEIGTEGMTDAREVGHLRESADAAAINTLGNQHDGGRQGVLEDVATQHTAMQWGNAAAFMDRANAMKMQFPELAIAESQAGVRMAIGPDQVERAGELGLLQGDGLKMARDNGGALVTATWDDEGGVVDGSVQTGVSFGSDTSFTDNASVSQNYGSTYDARETTLIGDDYGGAPTGIAQLFTDDSKRDVAASRLQAADGDDVRMQAIEQGLASHSARIVGSHVSENKSFGHDASAFADGNVSVGSKLLGNGWAARAGVSTTHNVSGGWRDEDSYDAHLENMHTLMERTRTEAKGWVGDHAENFGNQEEMQGAFYERWAENIDSSYSEYQSELREKSGDFGERSEMARDQEQSLTEQGIGDNTKHTTDQF